MGKKFKSSTKLTAKFLAVLLVLQAVFFALAASADVTVTAVTIKKGTTNVTGTSQVAFLGTNLALSAGYAPSTPTTATYRANTWGSSDTTVATLTTPTGGVTTSLVPVAKGTTTITLKNTLTNKTASVTVSVYRKLTNYIIPSALTVKVGQTGNIGLTSLSPSDADVTSTVYSTLVASSIFTLNTATGAILGVGKGSGLVRVSKTLPDGTHIDKTFNVTVPEPVTAVDISMDGRTPVGNTLNVNLEDKTTLKAIVSAAPGKIPTDKGVTWSKVSGSANIVIDSRTGALTITGAVYGDTAKIKLTANDTVNSASDTVDVTLVHKLTGIRLPQTSLTLRYNETGKQISPATLTGITPTITSVTYTSDKLTVAGVTVSGQVYSVGPGTAKITVKVTAADGTFKTATLPVTVTDKITTITLRPTTLALKLYGKASIASTFAPTTARYNYARFTSSNPSVAFVNPLTGEVTAIGVGSATIKSSADTVNSNSVTVTVTNPDGLE